MSDDLQTLWEPRMSKPAMSDDNERAARLAGWEKGCGCSDPEWCGRNGMWRHKGRAGHTRPPDYENSIDAQIRDLDPLVEARYEPFDELHLHFGSHGRRVRLGEWAGDDFRTKFVGDGDSWASARLRALLAALEAQP